MDSVNLLYQSGEVRLDFWSIGLYGNNFVLFSVTKSLRQFATAAIVN